MDIDKFLDENPPPSAENQQTLMELTETTENLWAKQNALFAYNRVMEISERFSYHSQILENMVATQQQGNQQHVGVGLPRVPVASGARMEEEEVTDPLTDGTYGESFVEGANGTVSDGVTSDNDNQTDSGATRSLRYILYIPHSS